MKYKVHIKDKQGKVTSRFAVNAVSMTHAVTKVDKIWAKATGKPANCFTIYLHDYPITADLGLPFEYKVVKCK